MARIPRSEATVDFRPTAQPFSSGDGYEAPGRGLQRIGQGIQALGGAFASLQGIADKDDEFNTKLKLLELSNEQDREDMERQQSFNIDRDDPDNYSTERVGSFEARAAAVMQSAKSQRAQQMAALQIARMRGSVGERAQRFAGVQKQQKLYFGAERAITGEFSKIGEPLPDLGNEMRPLQAEGARDPNLMGPTPEEGQDRRAMLEAERFETTLRAAEAIINDIPGSSETKQRLAKHVRDQALAYFGKRGESWPEAETWLKRHQVPSGGVMGQAPSGPAGPWKIYDRDTPTAAERRAIAQSGGVVVNLDTNWAKGDRPTSPMVVIPDNASPAQREAAQAYAAGVSQMYREKFGVDLKPRVVTRSQNGRGRNDTIHTEPFSVNDTKAVDFFTSPEGRKAHADLLRNTFGKIPGVAFSLPHDPTRKGDKGAVGPRGSEVDLARGLLAELQGGGGGAQPSQGVASGGGIRGNLTAYAPQRGASDVAGAGGQGSYAAARPGPDGKAEVRTLDDVASGRSQYVTIAGNPELFGREYTIPKIEFIDKNGQRRTLQNVRAVVHDTGSAFRTAQEGRFDLPVARDADEKTRNANHALWKQAGVEFVPAGAGDDKPVRVAQANTGTATDARPMNTIPGSRGPEVAGSAASAAIASPVRAELVEALRKAAPAMRQRYMAGLDKAISQVEEQAAKGYEVPDAMLNRLVSEVSRSGDQTLMSRIQATAQTIVRARATNQANPAELTAVIQRMEAEALRTPPTPQQINDLEHFKKKRTEITNALGHNPYELGTKNGLLPGAVPPIMPGMEGDQLTASMQARSEYRAALHARYYPEIPLDQSPLPFLQNAEKEAFTAHLKQGGREMIATLGMMHDTWGKNMPKAMAEISKDAPDVATIGWLVSQNASPDAIKAAADGLALRASHGFQSRLPKDADLDTTVRATVMPAFQANPKSMGMAVEVAKLIYETKAFEKMLDPKVIDQTLWRESLQQAMGQNKLGDVLYGGTSRVGRGWLGGGSEVFVPPFVKTDGGMTEIMSKLKLSDLGVMIGTQEALRPTQAEGARDPDATGPTVAEGEPPVPTFAMPVDAQGRPVSIAVVRAATPVWLTGARYVLRTGTDAAGNPTYLKAGGLGDRNFVIDVEALRPVLEPRVAKGTFRSSDNPPTIPDLLKRYMAQPKALESSAPEFTPRFAPGKQRGQGQQRQEQPRTQ